MKKERKSLKKIMLISVVIVSLLTLCIAINGCGNDNTPIIEAETGISIPGMTYNDGVYSLTVDETVEKFDLKSLVVLSDSASMTVSASKEFTTDLNGEDLPLVPGNNMFYLKVVDKNGNYATYSANIYRKQIYSVEFNTNGGTAIDTKYVVEGTKLVPPSTTKAGYQLQWDFDFSKSIYKNIKVNALWTPIEYQITINNGDNSTEIKVDFDEEYDLNDYIPQKIGYRFTGWGAIFGEGEEAVTVDFATSGKFSQTSNITIVPKFKPIEYSITYSIEVGGANDEKNVKKFTIEDIIDLLPAKWNNDEKVFAGWYTSSDYSEESKITQITNLAQSIELWAKFEDVIFETNVNFVVNGETIKTDKFTYKSSYAITAAAPQKGYVFDGWYYGETKVGMDGVWPFKDAEIELVAKFNERVNKIEYHLNGGTNADNPSEYNVEMGVVELKAPTFGRHEFLGWFVDEAFQTPITELTVDNVTEEMDIYAKWQYKSYVIFDVNGGTCETTDATYSFGAIYTLPTPILAGNLFDGWYYIDAENETPVKVTSGEWKYKEDITLVARYTPTTIAINYELNGGTQNSQNPEEFDVFTGVIQLFTPTKNDLLFAGWYTEPEFKNKIVEIDTAVVREITLYAKWIETEITVNYNPDGGSVSRPSDIIIYGNQYALPTPEKSGYDFDGWYYEGSLVPMTGTWSIISDIVDLKAKWIPKTYKIEYDLGGVEIEAELVGEYNVTSPDIHLSKITSKDYLFLGWKNANGDVSLDVTIPSGSMGDLSYKAVWLSKKDGSGFVYEFYGDYMACVDYVRPVDSSRSMRLPRTYGGYPVEVIGERAFTSFGEKYANSSYKNQNYYYTILIPTTIKVIEADAFANCSGMCVMLYLDNYKLIEDIKNQSEKAALMEWEATMTYSIVENESNTNTQVRDCIWGFRPAIGWSRYSAVEIPSDYYDKKN